MTTIVSDTRTGKLGGYVKKPLIAAATIALADLFVLSIGFGFVPRTTFVLLLFLEGGVGLIGGVIIALSSSPSITKVGEVMIGTAAWSRDSEKHAEKVASKWILASTVLIAVGFIVAII